MRDRAVRRAHADYEALSNIGRQLAATLAETPALIAAQIEKLNEAEKTRRKLALELAQARGRQLYSETPPDVNGIRRVHRNATAITDELRAEAQAFTAGSKGVFVAIVEDPPSLLLAASKDAGINAGQFVRDAVTQEGGRGGGNPAIAQGSVPNRDALDRVVRRLPA